MKPFSSFWPGSAYNCLERNTGGWLVPTQAYWRWVLQRPELALVPESCPAEIALHHELLQDPVRVVSPADLDALQDSDARENYAVYVRFRDGLLAAGTLEAWYLERMRTGVVDIPAVLVDVVLQAIVCNVLEGVTDATVARAAEMFFRPQRVALQSGQMLAGDKATLDVLQETAGLGDLGRVLLQSGALQAGVDVRVLSADTAADYWGRMERYQFLLDLTHELTQDLSHGLTLKLTRARSGLKALAQVLERWLAHMLAVTVHIEPVHQINDPQWRWHVGLDVESSAILNDLYEERPVDADRMQRMVSLFILTFENPHQMRFDVTGKPVYLGLATDAQGVLRLKPQNLLINLPLAAAV
jgi:hypothetical protein